jgi:hypothetical protein
MCYTCCLLSFQSPVFMYRQVCPHTVFNCSVWISEQTAVISLYNINWLVFVTKTECVYCTVQAGCLNTCIIQVNVNVWSHFHCCTCCSECISCSYPQCSVLTDQTVLSLSFSTWFGIPTHPVAVVTSLSTLATHHVLMLQDSGILLIPCPDNSSLFILEHWR